MDIKSCYNSEASQATYVNKTWLMPIEEYIFSFVLSLNTTIRILDLGCWWWRTTVALYEKWFHNIVGIDFAENLIAGAKNKYPEHTHLFDVGDATHLEKHTTEQYDIVFFSFNGIDYIPTRDLRIQAYKEIHRVLRSWWLFIFSSHNRYCLPVNRHLFMIQMRNIHRLYHEYWIAKQSFWDVATYFSSEKELKKDLWAVWFKKLLTLPTTNQFLFPFFDTFPHYIYQKV